MGLHTITTSYIPNPDPEALMWMEQFARGLRGRGMELKPAAFGVEVAQVAALAALVRAFGEKFAVVRDPGRCTGPAITAKIEARNAATLAIKPLVKTIRGNPEVADEQLLMLGLPARNGPRRKEIPAPGTAPLLHIIAALDGYHTLRVSDSRTPDSRRKPSDVQHLMLYVAVGKVAATDPKDFKFHSHTGKCAFIVEHDPADNGKMATYLGRWSTRTGLTGPWSLPVSMTISFVQRGG